MCTLFRCTLPLLLPILVACGQDPAGAPIPAPPPAPLSFVPGTPSTAADRVVRRLELPQRAEQWPSDAARSEVVEVNGARSLHLVGGTHAQVAIPGTYRPGEFNLVQVEFATSYGTTLRVGLRDEDGAAVGATDLAFLLPGQRKRFEFDLRALERKTGSFHELVLLANRDHIGEEELDWAVLDVRLVHRPLERWLPDPREPALVNLMGEARWGFGLVAGTPLSARLEVPDGEPRLRLACGPAPRTSKDGLDATVLVIVEDEVVARIRPEDRWVEHTWHDEVVDMTEFAGREVQVALELEADSEVMVSVEQPMIYVPEDASTVLLITSDTHRGAYLGAVDAGVDVTTPNLDALADRGVLFEDCFVGANVTLPSHVSLMTGRDPTETGVSNNRTRLAERADTLADRFAAAGYLTYAATSAKHLNDGWSGLGQGFVRYDWPAFTTSRAGPETIERALEWIEDAAGQPLFLWVHVFDAHRPYEPPEEIARHYYGDGDPYDESLPEPPWHRPGSLEGVRDAAWVEAMYRGEVEYLDGHLARLFDHPRVRSGILAFTSDHGEALGDQGIWWDHLGVYPAILHVPLILVWPDAPAGTTVTAPVRQFSVGRTLLRLAGVDDAGFSGRDLAPLWSGESPPTTPRFALGSDGHAAAVTSGGWHLVVNLRNPKDYAITRDNARDHPVELFDLSRDPRCEQDRSGEEPERVARMGRSLLRWLGDAPAELAEHNDIEPGDAAMLAGLGYASEGEEGVALIDMEEVRARLRPWIGE